MEIINMKKIKFWNIFSYVVLGLVISPILYIFFNSFKPNSELTDHIFTNLLKEYVINTLLIIIPVVILTTIIGILLAYFETFYDYKFRKFFKYTNILSFAIPSYLFAYIYVDMITGPIYQFLLKHNINLYIDIANKKGAVFILTIAFYPYVYITTSSYMRKMSMNLIYSSKLLGKNSIQTFFKLIIPMSRPAIIAGVSLVIMESLNAFGVPYFFGIPVFSTGIYDAWINYYDLDGAIKLSSILMIVVFSILFFEKILKRGENYKIEKATPIKRYKLKKKYEILLLIFLFTLFSVSFLIPILYLFRWVSLTINVMQYGEILEWTKNTIVIMLIATAVIIIITLFLTNVNRREKEKNRWIFDKITALGYTIPGSIIAIGFLSIFITIDTFLIDKGIISEMVLIQSSSILIVAYVTRFMSIAYTNIKAAQNKIGNSHHEVSRTLGKGPLKTFFLVDLPMMKSSVIASILLVSIEIMKELPLVSLLSNKTNLAIAMKNYAADEELSLIGMLAFIMILVTLIMMIIYNKIENRGEK